MFNVLIVEDDMNIRKLMQVRLTNSGFNVYTAYDGISAISSIASNTIDLIILDIMMPNMDGFEFIEIIRKSGNDLPVIMVTSKESYTDKEKAFNLGVDDYMVKPINHDELILRINALLKRYKISTDKKIIINNLVIDYNTFSIIDTTDETRTTVLPKKEFQILYKLLSYPNQVFTKLQILNEFWGYYSEADDSLIKVHMNKIRTLTEQYDDFKIETIRGLGYRGVKYEK